MKGLRLAAASWALLSVLPPAVLPEQSKEPEALERKMFELLNQEREARGIHRLELSPALAAVALEHSRKMAAAGKASHEVEGTRMEERIRRVLPNACGFGENISRHFTVDYALGDLLGSPGHRANLLNPEWALVGIGIVEGDDHLLYITQNFVRLCRQNRRARTER